MMGSTRTMSPVPGCTPYKFCPPSIGPLIVMLYLSSAGENSSESRRSRRLANQDRVGQVMRSAQGYAICAGFLPWQGREMARPRARESEAEVKPKCVFEVGD